MPVLILREKTAEMPYGLKICVDNFVHKGPVM